MGGRVIVSALAVKRQLPNSVVVVSSSGGGRVPPRSGRSRSRRPPHTSKLDWEVLFLGALILLLGYLDVRQEVDTLVPSLKQQTELLVEDFRGQVKYDRWVIEELWLGDFDSVAERAFERLYPRVVIRPFALGGLGATYY